MQSADDNYDTHSKESVKNFALYQNRDILDSLSSKRPSNLKIPPLNIK